MWSIGALWHPPFVAELLVALIALPYGAVIQSTKEISHPVEGDHPEVDCGAEFATKLVPPKVRLLKSALVV